MVIGTTCTQCVTKPDIFTLTYSKENKNIGRKGGPYLIFKQTAPPIPEKSIKSTDNQNTDSDSIADQKNERKGFIHSTAPVKSITSKHCVQPNIHTPNIPAPFSTRALEN